MDPSSILPRASPRFLVRNRMSGPDGDVLEVVFEPNEDISERVIFPITEAQSNGIGDARFVDSMMTEETFYATYTACNGRGFGPS
jgi:hypothetical protein